MNIILGQGLAGSVLALEMIKRGEKVLVVDNGHRSSSSMVAAGLWNPIVFRRINKGWMADELIASLDSFYLWAERMLKAKFYHSVPIWRIHSSDLESSLWREKMPEPEFAPYLHPSHDKPSYSYPVFPYGDGVVLKSGFLDVPVFLEATRVYLESTGAFVFDDVALPDTEDTLNAWIYKGHVPERIIDCRGYKTAQGAWFSYLPFGLTKGEVLTITCPGLDLDKVFNSGFFLLPLGGDHYRLGATFNWDDRDELTTAAARDELLKKFQKWVKLPFEVVNQKAGVRPTVVDRRPLIGRHPKAEKLYIFNGLGTKGVMVAPLMAAQFCAFLNGDGDIHTEADISRFSRHYEQK